jgi:hypothetical protein
MRGWDSQVAGGTLAVTVTGETDRPLIRPGGAMHISHHIARQLASEHMHELGANAAPRRESGRRRLALRRLRILKRRPLAAPSPRAGH